MKKRVPASTATAAPTAPSLKIYCPVFNHIKNTIVCSLCCAVRERCKDFQQFYEENREAQDASVNAYIESHHRLPPGSLLTIQYSLEVLKKKMSDTYVWIDQDDRAEVMTMEQILQAADTGRKPKHIFLTKQELVLRYQLIPKSRREETPAPREVKEHRPTEVPGEVELPKTEDEDKPKKRGRPAA